MVGKLYQAPTVSWSKSVVGTKSNDSPLGLCAGNRHFLKVPCLENPGRADAVTNEILRVEGVNQVTLDIGSNLVGVVMSALVSSTKQPKEILEMLTAAVAETGVQPTFVY
jgi:hypothetical protein